MLVFLFLGIILAFVFSKIRIEIENFQFSSLLPKHINHDYRFTIKLCILGKIPILKITITKEKIKKLKLKEKFQKIDLWKIEEDKQIHRKFFQITKKLNLVIQKLNLKIAIGTENASITSFIVVFLSSFIALFLQNKLKHWQKQTFLVQPIFQNQNLVNLEISGIFEIQMIHIITIVYILNKKEGVKKNERTSNRRAYGYSYE